MVLSSFLFLLAFLPLTLIVYFLFVKTNRHRAANVVLLLASLVFYTWENLRYAWVIVVTILVTYGMAELMHHRPAHKKAWLWIGALFHIFALAFFKYFNAVSDALHRFSNGEGDALTLLLPLGISFFTFQEIAFLVDTYRAEAPRYRFLDFALYVAYFPKLLQGPMAMHNDFLPQITDPSKKCISADTTAKALARLAQGLCKKVLLADTFALFVTYGFSNLDTLTSLEALLTIFGYTMQLYFDFDGYSDMAIGVSLLFGIRLPENFNSPYRACDILDFWKRWHITLTNFLTKYIYFPLGGNRRGKARTYLNVLIVFLVSGIWHGAGLVFLVWGLLHGVVSVLTRIWKKVGKPMPKALAWPLFFLFINLSWIPFRAPSFSAAATLLTRVFSGGFTISAALRKDLQQPFFLNIPSAFLPMLLCVGIFFGIGLLLSTLVKNGGERELTFRPTVYTLLCTFVLLVLGLLSIPGIQSFLYVNF